MPNETPEKTILETAIDLAFIQAESDIWRNYEHSLNEIRKRLQQLKQELAELEAQNGR